MDIRANVAAGLQTGFIDCNLSSLEQYHPKLVVNDYKRGIKVLSSIVSELRQCEEFYFSVAFITNSGVASIISALEELQEKGDVKGRIIASQYQNFTQPEALRRLMQFSNIDLRVVTEGNFHAKGYIFRRKDRYSFIIGSSNLTQAALSENKEWNVKLTSLEHGLVMQNILNEFQYTFDHAVPVTDRYLDEYSKVYAGLQRVRNQADRLGEEHLFSKDVIHINEIRPNKMQVEAMHALDMLRKDGKDKALLVSATGTGKTYLSAFDAAKVAPERLLFVVHRENIARAALESYERIFRNAKTMGLYTGNVKDRNKDYLFSTIQTLSKGATLQSFNQAAFDYIVIDEVHRSGAESYQRILRHFKPKFLLGMSATPERTDGYDIFRHFDYNVAYEIRLHRALEENMLSPFHYYGVQDIEVDGEAISEHTAFNRLVSDERVRHIVERTRFYGCDQGRVKGLIFCSRVEEAHSLSEAFNSEPYGYRTIALDGTSSEEAREDAIKRLEHDEEADCLDYIFSVDIFNEGVDIPEVNQIVMLRPTQSAIIFVQQLGRGLRKTRNKKYLTVIDFIGNYSNNYLVPVALYGDRSYNKDTLRKLINSGNSTIPGSSTVNFDYVTRQQIFESIDTKNLSLKKDLKNDYTLLKYELGRIPTMMDFVEYGRREPYAFVTRYDSYYNFLLAIGETPPHMLTEAQRRLMNFYSKEILNGKRVEESILLGLLIAKGQIDIDEADAIIEDRFSYTPSEATWDSAVRHLNGLFIKERLRDDYGIQPCVSKEGDTVRIDDACRTKLLDRSFHYYLDDMIRYSVARFERDYSHEQFRNGFMLNQKYGRKDACRILNWEQNEESTIYGYRIKYDTCPIFVTYNKGAHIAESIKYRDEFINQHRFKWETKNRIKLDSQVVHLIKDPAVRKLLFVKKSDGEGTDFYYLSDVTPIEFNQTQIPNDKGKLLPTVNIVFQMQDGVEESLYGYLTAGE